MLKLKKEKLYLLFDGLSNSFIAANEFVFGNIKQEDGLRLINIWNVPHYHINKYYKRLIKSVNETNSLCEDLEFYKTMNEFEVSFNKFIVQEMRGADFVDLSDISSEVIRYSDPVGVNVHHYDNKRRQYDDCYRFRHVC